MTTFLTTALAQDPSIERARAAIAAAESGVTAARWQFGPSPSVSRELAAGGKAYVNIVRLDQPLYTGGLLTANLNAAKTQLQGSQFELSAAQLQLKLRIVTTWADWNRARGRVDALEELRQQHQQLHAMIERRSAAGVGTASDAALAVSRLSAVTAELAQARLEESLQRDQLQRLARRPVDESLRDALAGDLPAPPPLQDLLAAIPYSPQTALARAGIDLAREELAKSRAALLPTVSLRMDHQSGAVHDRRIGLVMQANLGGGLGSFANMDAARSRIRAAEAAVEASQQEQLDRYQLEYTRYAAATASLRNATETAAASEQVLASYRRQFEAGKRAWLDLLNMVREAHAARQSQRDAAVEERAGLFRLRLLMDPGPSY